MKTTIIGVLAACAAFGAPASGARAQSGTAIVQRMHDAYAGKWYKTLTFVQRTIIARPTGVTDTTTWYETLSGVRLRIDIGSPSLGNGTIYNADSGISVRNGAVARVTPTGNVFLPLIMGVYLQPVATTLKQLQAFHFDLSKTYANAQWHGEPVTVVGAANAADTTSAQFWVDKRNLVVRVRGNLFGAQNADIDLGGYEKIGDAWLATLVKIRNGQQNQEEKYSDWKANVPLSEALFDPAQWKTAPHWAK
jgi:hypothetical protein